MLVLDVDDTDLIVRALVEAESSEVKLICTLAELNHPRLVILSLAFGNRNLYVEALDIICKAQLRGGGAGDGVSGEREKN